ncbi:MAG: sulfatase-like hydrolase/transferase [Opitutaceae bacterium]|nr:sulfatase-like hydrolase/transferase [Opitutaceae bacterium]
MNPKSSLAAVLFMAACLISQAAPRPNIIFILVDDLGYGDVGIFNQNQRRDSGDRSKPWFATPTLDRMAESGARFTHHYVAAPVCVSSRSSLIQGVTQGHANVRDNQFDKAIDNNHTIASVLRTAGYATAAIGKWGLQGDKDAPAPNWPAHPLNRGFDYYYGYIRHIDGHEHYPKESLYFKEKARDRGPIVVWENRTDATAPLDKCYTADLWTARAKKWISERHEADAGKPFFLYLAYDTPHAVLELPTQPYPAGGGKSGGMQWLGTPGHAITTASGTPDSWIDPACATATYDDDRNPATPEKHWPDVDQRYATSVRRIDNGIGDLLQLLKDLGIDRNTLVVFCSDNGPSIESYLPEPYSPQFFGGFGPFDGIKRDCWEGGMRTPAIVRWPGGIKPGQIFANPSATYDWLPTFADLAGLPAPARCDGISLAPLLTGKGTLSSRNALYFEYTNPTSRTPNFPEFEPAHRDRKRGQMQALRVGDYIAVRYDIKSSGDDFEIYNVATDPKEAHNLARDPAFTARQGEFKALALQSRRPEANAPRPYDSALVPAVPAPVSLRRGLSQHRFEGNFPWVPNFTGRRSRGAAIVSNLQIGSLRSSKETGFLLEGFLNAPADGDYTFSLSTDTGAVMRLHDATIIDADFDYEGGSTRSATIRLKAGLHPLRLAYRTKAGARPALDVRWSGPGFSLQSIPDSALSHTPAK